MRHEEDGLTSKTSREVLVYDATQALSVWRAVCHVKSPAHLLVCKLLDSQGVVGRCSEDGAARVAGVKEPRHLVAKLNTHRVGRAHGKVALVDPRPKQAVRVAAAQVVFHRQVWQRRWRQWWRCRRRRIGRRRPRRRAWRPGVAPDAVGARAHGDHVKVGKLRPRAALFAPRSVG